MATHQNFVFDFFNGTFVGEYLLNLWQDRLKRIETCLDFDQLLKVPPFIPPSSLYSLNRKRRLAT